MVRKLLQGGRGGFWIPGLLLAGGFWVVAPFADRSVVYAVVNALALAVSFGIVATYATAVWETLTLPKPNVSGGHILVLGLVIAWFSSGERGVFSYVYQWAGQPDAMRNTLIQAFAVWMLFLGGLLHLTAKDAINGRLPKQSWIKLGIVVTIGLALAFLAALFVAPVDVSVLGDNPMSPDSMGYPPPPPWPRPAAFPLGHPGNASGTL